MPRQQTGTEERVQQNRRLREEVEVELGTPVSIARAAAHRRSQRDTSLLVARDIDFEDESLEPVGVVLAKVDEYKVIRGGAATLRLLTNAREFGGVLHDAARMSQSDVLAVAIYAVPREVDFEDGDDE